MKKKLLSLLLALCLVMALVPHNSICGRHHGHLGWNSRYKLV